MASVTDYMPKLLGLDAAGQSGNVFLETLLPHPSASSPYPSSPWLLAGFYASHFTEDTEALEVRFPFSTPSPSPGIPHPPSLLGRPCACLLSSHQAFAFFWVPSFTHNMLRALSPYNIHLNGLSLLSYGPHLSASLTINAFEK